LLVCKLSSSPLRSSPCPPWPALACKFSSSPLRSSPCPPWPALACKLSSSPKQGAPALLGLLLFASSLQAPNKEPLPSLACSYLQVLFKPLARLQVIFKPLTIDPLPSLACSPYPFFHHKPFDFPHSKDLPLTRTHTVLTLPQSPLISCTRSTCH